MSFRLERPTHAPKISVFGGFYPQNIGDIVQTPKRHILAWFHVFSVVARKNPSTGLTCTRTWEEKGINKKIFLLYFTHLPRSPQRVDLYQIWYRGFLVDVINCADFFVDHFRGIDFVGGGLKFAYSHRNWRSALTLSEPIVQTVMMMYCMYVPLCSGLSHHVFVTR